MKQISTHQTSCLLVVKPKTGKTCHSILYLHILFISFKCGQLKKYLTIVSVLPSSMIPHVLPHHSVYWYLRYSLSSLSWVGLFLLYTWMFLISSWWVAVWVTHPQAESFHWLSLVCRCCALVEIIHNHTVHPYVGQDGWDIDDGSWHICVTRCSSGVSFFSQSTQIKSGPGTVQLFTLETCR